MIRFQLDPEAPGLFTVIVYGEHIKILKNPALAANLPFWVQERAANLALQAAVPPRRRATRREETVRVAEVITIDSLRNAREARLASSPFTGT